MYQPEEQLLALLAQVRALSIRLSYGEGSESLPSGVLRVLRVLQSHESRNVPQIARATGTSRQNIQIVVNRLQRSGYVELLHNPSHKRSRRVGLTERGETLIKNYQEAEAGFLTKILSKVQKEDLAAATEVLHQIEQLLGVVARPKEPVASPRKIWPRSSVAGAKPSKGLSQTAVNTDQESEAEAWALPVNLL